jgi:probable rRNA maturation factor
LRLLIHGLLHLIGYDHEINLYQRKKMEKKERELLDAIKKVA